MEIKLTNKESEEYFYNALCNGLYVVQSDYGVEMVYDTDEYAHARENLKAKGESPCYEDILMEILRMGGTISLIDIEGEGAMDSFVNMELVHERVCKTPTDNLMNMIKEEDDANDADVLLQTVFFNDIVFG